MPEPAETILLALLDELRRRHDYCPYCGGEWGHHVVYPAPADPGKLCILVGWWFDYERT